MLWTVDDEDDYKALWEAPQGAPLGRYRFRIHANAYRLTSEPFLLRPARTSMPWSPRRPPVGP